MAAGNHPSGSPRFRIEFEDRAPYELGDLRLIPLM